MCTFKLFAWFFDYNGFSPDEVLELPKERMEELIQDLCDGYSDEGKKR
jgi:hypothetical protein